MTWPSLSCYCQAKVRLTEKNRLQNLKSLNFKCYDTTDTLAKITFQGFIDLCIFCIQLTRNILYMHLLAVKRPKLDCSSHQFLGIIVFSVMFSSLFTWGVSVVYWMQVHVKIIVLKILWILNLMLERYDCSCLCAHQAASFAHSWLR